MMYVNHRAVKNRELNILACLGPPNSAPMFGLNLLYIKTPIHTKAKIQKISTEKPKVPGGTLNS